MSEKNFTTYGNGPLEARIVAWVLGEASDFEVEELKRLCEEKPELAIFKHRIEAVHGLAHEAHLDKDDAKWKLPSKKRASIEELIGIEEQAHEDIKRDYRVGRSGHRALLAIAACVVMTVVVASVMSPIMFRQLKNEERALASPDSAHHSDAMRGMDGLLVSEEISASVTNTVGGHSIALSLMGQESASDSEKMVSDGMRESDKGRVVGSKVEALSEPAQMDPFAADLSAAPASPPAARPMASNALDMGVISDRKHQRLQEQPSKEQYKRFATRDASLDSNLPAASQSSAEGEGLLADGDAGGGGYLGEIPAAEVAPVSGVGWSATSGADDQLGRMKGRELHKLDNDVNSLHGQLSPNRQNGMDWDESTVRGGSVRSVDAKFAKDKIDSNTNGERRADLYRRAEKAMIVDEVRDDAKELDEARELGELLNKSDGSGVFQALIEQGEKKVLQKPRKRPIPTGDEIAAAEEPYSTFSLNINDASFRVAQAALARGEMPDPAGIKVEQFYNAVDYGDPTPTAGQPVACSIEQSAHPVIPGRNLVRVALKTASEGRNQGQPLRLTLLIDQSGSMAREDRRLAMVEALDGLRGLLGENDQVNVIGFARTARLLGEAIKGNQGQLGNLVNIEANEGGTNLEQALKLGEQLAERHLLEGAQNRVVLFTDGAANLGDADPESLAEKIKDLRQKAIAFDVAGIVADGLNDELLGEMARHGNGRYYVVGKGERDRFAEQLAGAFRPAAENVKVQVHFNPERIGRYKLIGFEKDRLNKEDFRNDAVDAAELAAEEAGVAIYQVETLPEGNGEIGEVSVRFRDLASGEMVERSWTISHEIATPALDQAGPVMQLAALAMLAGEKLKGGPLSDCVNFNEMGEVIAQVNQHFKGDPKVAEMMHMVEQLK